MGIISRPFGLFLFWLNNLFGNYGVALIVFTFIVRLLLLPLSIKQQKSMQDSQKIQPELLKIREKYKNDKQKLNDETMKLYKNSGVNPAGGCFPLLIQFPIIIGLYQVIIKPLTYMLSLSNEQIDVLTEKVNVMLAAKGGQIIEGVGRFEITIAENLQYLTSDVLESVGLAGFNFINFKFLGLNLAETPSLNFITVLWVIPLLAALTTFLSTKVTTMINGQQQQQEENSAASTMKAMNAVFPLMTAWFSFTMPAGVGFYWILGNIIQIFQQLLLNSYFKSKAEQQPIVEEKRPPVLEEKKPDKGGGRKNK